MYGTQHRHCAYKDTGRNTGRKQDTKIPKSMLRITSPLAATKFPHVVQFNIVACRVIGGDAPQLDARFDAVVSRKAIQFFV